MAFMKTNSVDITVNGQTYNSLSDFGLAIANTDYLGEPVQDTSNLIAVPGRSGMLDPTDTVFGGPSYTHRQIKISFGGLEDPTEWDSVISNLRNLFEGKKVQLTFATDPDWYWTGRVSIEKFAHNRALGEFDFCIPYADPFKYAAITSTQIWAKNVTDYVYHTIQVHGDHIPLHFNMLNTVPGRIYVEYKGEVYTFHTGDSDTDVDISQDDNQIGIKSGWSSTTGSYVPISYQDRSL